MFRKEVDREGIGIWIAESNIMAAFNIGKQIFKKEFKLVKDDLFTF